MSFLSELRYEDLRRLREAVYKVHMHHHPIDLCTDSEADRIIESLGPSVVETLLRTAVDNQMGS